MSKVQNFMCQKKEKETVKKITEKKKDRDGE